MKWIPTSALAHAVVDAGFWYDPTQDIIYSKLDAWQRNLGYTWAYDVAAAPLHMIIDCEPFYFNYAGKAWMIELWKGQYVLETGAEIGVYCDNNFGAVPLPPQSRFYACVKPTDQLRMRFTLYRKGNELLHRVSPSHWWLTGFKWGVFTGRTLDLTMRVEIVFPKAEMCDAFKQAAKDKGYHLMEMDPFGIAFTFDRPRTHQPTVRLELEGPMQASNERLVRGYNKLKQVLGLPNNDPNAFTPLQKAAQEIYAGTKKVKDHGAAAAKTFQRPASVATRLAGAKQLQSKAAVAAKIHQLEVTDEATGAYREMTGFFEKRAWHVNR